MTEKLRGMADQLIKISKGNSYNFLFKIWLSPRCKIIHDLNEAARSFTTSI